MTENYDLDNVILFLKARKEELNRQNVDIMAAYGEVDKLIKHFEMMKQNGNEMQ